MSKSKPLYENRDNRTYYIKEKRQSLNFVAIIAWNKGLGKASLSSHATEFN